MTSYAGLDLVVPGSVSGGVAIRGVSGGVSSMGVSGSPCRSTASDGDRPELELDMWEGQFSLSNDNIEGLEDGEERNNGGFVNDIVNSTNRWRKDSSVTCTTVQQLQEKVEALTDLHSPPDDKYTRLKQENAALYLRIDSLEKDIKERDRRNSPLINLISDTNESDILTDQIYTQIEKLKGEKCAAEDQLLEAQHLIVRTQEAHRALQETYRSLQEEWDLELQQSKAVIENLTKQLEDFKNVPLENGIDNKKNVPKDGINEVPERISDMEGEISVLRDQNKCLNNNNEEEAEMINKGIDQGIRIIKETNSKSLAQEIDNMSENQNSVCHSEELQKMRKALEDQKEVNDQLRSYIDTVLLNIMEKYPDLLEVRKVK